MIKREEIIAYAKEEFNTNPDYPWAKSPTYAVLRHQNTGKWYALIMDVKENKLGLTGDKSIEIINLKCDPELNSLLRSKEGVLPAYHMNKEHWITIKLNSSFPRNELFNLIALSYELTK